jgi:hypothetical protein
VDLVLPVKGIYFDQIKAGTKSHEFRLVNDYWTKRLLGRVYDRVIITKGYPRRDDAEKRIVSPWRGCCIEIITHEHFGSEPVVVFAIPVSSPQPSVQERPTNEQ